MVVFCLRKGISVLPSKTKIFYFPHKAGIRSRYYTGIGSEAMARAALDCDFDLLSVAFLFLLGLGKPEPYRGFSEAFLKWIQAVRGES